MEKASTPPVPLTRQDSFLLCLLLFFCPCKPRIVKACDFFFFVFVTPRTKPGLYLRCFTWYSDSSLLDFFFCAFWVPWWEKGEGLTVIHVSGMEKWLLDWESYIAVKAEDKKLTSRQGGAWKGIHNRFGTVWRVLRYLYFVFLFGGTGGNLGAVTYFFPGRIFLSSGWFHIGK